ncbi:acyl-CoA thioesterase domain-containing protein [Actinomadura syzygii]|uniref:Acyl-CoA thioesterase-like N-terminal HotDog domain-containing protein n=1 Tax=Actinomadura syzygii TaxID=1427538 RepID=A0A5D0U813_9ACTN|nr:acyl-CoA thioesterase domain-containing protein [Actinomadura syzygii]TYC13179.1 hypothetical protein FXF65_22005 [Actinomadura syzygii]
MSDEAVVRRALAAVAATRVRGLHPIGHLAGITGRPSRAPGRSRLTMNAPPGTDGRTGRVSLVGLDVFADLVLAAAIRSHIGPGARLGTVSLSVQHLHAPVSGEIVGEASAEPPVDGFAASRAVLRAGDRVVAHAQGSFMVLPTPEGRARLTTDWEREHTVPLPVIGLDDLDPAERRFVESVRSAARRAAGTGRPLEDELVEPVWADRDPPRAGLVIGPEMGNRVGHVQGGVLYAVAARAAAHVAGPGPWSCADGTYQYLRPGAGRVLTARPVLLRRGRAMAFARVELAVDGVAVGGGQFAFRTAPQARLHTNG